MDFLCPNCGKMLTVPDQYTGTRLKCPLCAASFTAPNPPRPPPPEPTAPPRPDGKPQPRYETPIALLKFIAKGALNAVGAGIAGELLVELLPNVARDAWTWWTAAVPPDAQLTEVALLAQVTPAEVRPQVQQIVEDVASGQPESLRRDLAAYLTQVPAMVQKSLRRPGDPSGRTIPAGLRLRRAEDLLAFLPPRLPRFKVGDQPPGIGDWELELLLGVGGFSEVWKARNPHLPHEEPVALKFCLDEAAARALRTEAVLLGRVRAQGRHPGIVQLRHTYLGAEVPCLEYEFVEGGDLAGVIREWHASEQKPDPVQAARVILRLAEIVSHAHRLNPPIVHRDLKPANILVQRREDGGTQFKVADFGIGGVAASQALRQASRGLTQGQQLVSVLHGAHTPLYASPQQARGDPPAPGDDVYALGVIWHQLLIGDLSKGTPSGDLWKKRLKEQHMPQPLIDLLVCCFEEDPEDRPADAAVLAEKIALLLAGPTPAPPPSPTVAESPAPIAAKAPAPATGQQTYGAAVGAAPLQKRPLPPPSPREGPNYIKIVEHSQLLYWWPVWLVGFILGLISMFSGERLAVLPHNSRVHYDESRGVWVVEAPQAPRAADANEFLTDAETRSKEGKDPFTLHVAQDKNLGVVWAFVLILVIIITNVPLRGMWSVVVLVSVLILSPIVLLSCGWSGLSTTLQGLTGGVYISLGGYLIVSTALFILWAVTVFLFDQQRYWIFTPGQLRIYEAIGGAQIAFDTHGMATEKHRDDLFRHWILGLGTGDLTVRTVTGAQVKEFKIQNVWWVGHKLSRIQKMQREWQVVAGSK